MAASSPLDGVTVLDLASVGPAARTSRWLSDYGACVVKIGPTPKHGGTQIAPPHYAYGAHRGMKRALLDLKHASGVDAFLRLASGADVVIESFRPGVVDRLGIGYSAVRAANPGIVYCSTTGYGQTGPYAHWAGHDLDYLALGGYLACSGRDAYGAPALPGATIADGAAGGMHAATAILAALVQRDRTGEGAYLDVAVTDGVVALMSLFIDEYLATGREPGPRHDILTGRYACYGVYQCADGNWIAVAAIEPSFFTNLCRALGCEQWIGHQTDDDVQGAIRADLRAAFATRDRRDWVATLAAADTCVAPVNSIPEVVEDPHLRARSAFVSTSASGAGGFRQVGRILAGMPRAPMDVPDWSETDTDALLGAAGIPDDDVARLRAEGAIA